MQTENNVFPTSENELIEAITADIMSAKGLTTTTNGAIVPLSTGDAFVDQFGKAGNFRGRDMGQVSKDMATLWDENPELALRFAFYLRMITRVVKFTNKRVTEKLQKGQGVRDESFKRLLWIAQFHPDVFYKNIWLLPFVGSWKDIWSLMVLAQELNIVINAKIMYTLLAIGLNEKQQADLIIKFMPRIKTKSNIKTDRSKALSDLARGFAEHLGLTPRKYNKMKSGGAAHEFQRLICEKNYEELNWGMIPGIALGKLTSGNFFQKHSLVENYIDWLSKQDSIKFNGYPYDLLNRLKKYTNTYFLLSDFKGNKSSFMGKIPEVMKRTIDLQFQNLIKKVEKDGKWSENVLCALDTSGSMASGCNPNINPIDVCISLGIYFSELNKGHFKNKVMMFDSDSEVVELHGTFTEKLGQIHRDAMGSTNFESIIKSLVNYRKEHPEIPLEEYATTILVVSDMQFNQFQSSLWGTRSRNIAELDMDTVYDKMKEMLLEAFPQEFVDSMKFIWWNVNGSHNNMPAEKKQMGCIFCSGLDGSTISFILGEELKELPEKKKLTAEEVVQNALNQEVLQLVSIEK